MIEKAVIVAAGESSRIRSLTQGRPKTLLALGKQSILERSLEALRQNGIRQIGLVVGHGRDELVRGLDASIAVLQNPFYKISNNMASLWFARSFVGRAPFVYLHSDVVYEPMLLTRALEHFVGHAHDIELMTGFGRVDEEAMKVRVSREFYLIESSKKIAPEQAQGEWTGLACIRGSEGLFGCIEEVLFEGLWNAYDTEAFTRLANRGGRVFCPSTEGLKWIEVDDPQDYEKAKAMFP